ncbi:DEAD/DEAH box helicase [Leptolyngbya sp. 15MV]|nr:DEAD/DEAH box helicase [Leptolyngbya sp. 15MV]
MRSAGREPELRDTDLAGNGPGSRPASPQARLRAAAYAAKPAPLLAEDASAEEAAENPEEDAPEDEEDSPDEDGASDEDEIGPTEEDEALAEEAAKTTFADLGLSEPILRAVGEAGYLYPTPIQEQAIPVVLMGRDVLGVAQTGTGKTAGFTLPMLDILAGSRAKARMPRSLILEPTRELALQVAEQFVKYGKHLSLNHALLIGGESMNDQRDVLDKGVDVLIATPGRLLDLFDRGRVLLADCKVLVIDEADRMLDMGFIPDVERIVGFLPKLRQTLFFSATMAPEIRRLADAFLQNPKEISVSRPATVATTITTGLVWVREHDKREALRRLLRKEEVQNALIFCNRKVDVNILYKSLKKHDFSVGELHGDMDQSQRFATLNRFKAGEIKLLVCSDVAARGLDIGGLSHVFNFDVPFHAEDYVHRIGRTGRAGREGNAFTLAAPEDAKSRAAIVAPAARRMAGDPFGNPSRSGVRGEPAAHDPPGRPDQQHRGGERDRARDRRSTRGPAPHRRSSHSRPHARADRRGPRHRAGGTTGDGRGHGRAAGNAAQGRSGQCRRLGHADAQPGDTGPARARQPGAEGRHRRQPARGSALAAGSRIARNQLDLFPALLKRAVPSRSVSYRGRSTVILICWSEMIATQNPITASALDPSTVKAAPLSPFQPIATSSRASAITVGTARTMNAVPAFPAETSSDSRLAPTSSIAPATARITIAQ